MRVAITHPYSWPEVRRGAERIIMETGRALAGRGHEVTILSSGWEPVTDEYEGAKVVRLRRRHEDPRRHERWFARAVVLPLLRGRFDAVHSIMPRDSLSARRVGRITGHRSVYEEMGIPVKEWWGNLPDGRVRARLAERVDVYACMSRHALEALERTCHRKGVLIPGGVRLAEFTPRPREPQPTILFSGALDEPRKGVATLVEAVALVAEHEPGVQLWLSGPGDVSAILDAAPEAGRRRTEVLPLGDPGEQADRYGRAWVTSLPSTYESFGMTLLESLACGTPIVVADHSAPPELAEPGAGVVSVPGDAPSLAQALLAGFALARDDATVERCREIASRYDWDAALAPHLERLYAGEDVVFPDSLVKD